MSLEIDSNAVPDGRIGGILCALRHGAGAGQRVIMGLAGGSMLSHYRLAGKIGQGGMGEVYRSRDTKSDLWIYEIERDLRTRFTFAFPASP